MRSNFLVWGLAGLFWVAPEPVLADPILSFFSRTATAGAQVGGIFTEHIDRNADVLGATASAAQGLNEASAESTFVSQLTSNNQLLSGYGVAPVRVF